MNEWVRVEDQLPKYGKTVLLFLGGKIGTGYRESTDKNGEHWGIHRSVFREYEVTHWMPLPAPPA